MKKKFYFVCILFSNHVLKHPLQQHTTVIIIREISVIEATEAITIIVNFIFFNDCSCFSLII